MSDPLPTYVPPLPGLAFEWNVVPMPTPNGFVYFARHAKRPAMIMRGPRGWEAR